MCKRLYTEKFSYFQTMSKIGVLHTVLLPKPWPSKEQWWANRKTGTRFYAPFDRFVSPEISSKKTMTSKDRKFQLIWATTWQNQQNECAPSEDSDQPWHPPSLIRVFAVRMKKAQVLSYPLSAQRRLWSDWADAQADLSLRWAHSHFVGFVMRRLICPCAWLHFERFHDSNGKRFWLSTW